MCYYSYYNKPKSPRGILPAIQRYDEPLPKDYEKYENSCFERTMFVTRISKGVNHGRCECGGHIILGAVRSGAVIKCPNCNKKVLIKKNKYNSNEQRKVFAYVVPFKDGYLSRLFVVYKFSSLDKDGIFKVKILQAEEQRDYFDGNNIFSYHPYRRYGSGTKWLAGRGTKHGSGYCGWRVDELPINTYPKNLKALFRGTEFQYSQLQTASVVHNVDPLWYLTKYKNEPKLELMYKLGLYEVASEILRSDGSCYEAKRILDEVKSLKDLGIESKSELKECRFLGTEQLIARKEIKKWAIDKKDKPMAIEFVKRIIRRCGADFKYSFATRERWFKYYKTQLADYPFSTVEENRIPSFIADYTDYVSDCTRLNLDLKDTAIKFPKSLKTAHQWTINELEIQKTQVYDALVEAVYESMHRLVEWSDGKLTVIMPKTTRQVIEEGQKQSHCVGRYCERIATGESIIVFIRKVDSPDKPYFTAELKNDMRMADIVQCRGYKNSDAPKEVQAFIKKYKQWFRKRPFGEFNQSSLMMHYFKAVHKRDGKYISNADNGMEFEIGEWAEEPNINKDPDQVAVPGLHVASLEFAQKFGNSWSDVAILEVETNIHDVIIPDAKDQVRTSKFRVLREVPFEEMGEWGAKRIKSIAEAAA